MKKLLVYGTRYLETILDIIEDKPSFILPNGFNYLLISIFYFQISGYTFSTFELKPMTEPKIAYVAHLNEVSPGTFLLYMKGYDPLTTIVFFLMNLLMFFYFIYVGTLTVLKEKKP
jgi:hypothetical protein